MRNDVTMVILILAGSLLAGFGCGMLAKHLIEKRRREKVLKFSFAYQQLLKINREFMFKQVGNPTYNIYQHYKSRMALEHADDMEMAEYLMYQDEELRSVFDRVTYNRQLYEEYRKQVNSIQPTPIEVISESRLKEQKFINLEKELCSSTVLRPVTDINIMVHLKYVSPKGRSQSERLVTATYRDLVSVYESFDERQRVLVSAKLERAKMNDSLRYDIMKRDGFRCVLCGATTEDGVKLHVDHILPVSKGGRTVPDNLRTLCDRCNLGKKDKYDSNGLN